MKILAGVIFWMFVGQISTNDLKNQLMTSFRYATGKGELKRNTLLVKMSTEGSDVIAGVFQWSQKDGNNYRTDTGQRRRIPGVDWNNEVEFKPAPDLEFECNDRGEYSIRVKHPENGRFDEVRWAEGKPLYLKPKDQSPPPRPETSKPPVCQPPPSTAQMTIDQSQQIIKAAQTTSQSERKARILLDLQTDMKWFESTMAEILGMKEIETAQGAQSLREVVKDGLQGRSAREYSFSDISEAQRVAMHSLLDQMSKQEVFKKNPERADRLLVALTLEGEFRRNDKRHRHRTLAHLFWAYESMKNRAKVSNISENWKLRYRKINSEFTEDEPELEKFLINRLGGVVLATDQYSAWNLGDATLSDILTGSSRQIDPNIKLDILDFVAAADAGFISVDEDEKLPFPFLTHYVSPKSLPQLKDGSPRYPPHWTARNFKVFKAESLPKIFRKDLKDHSRSLVSFPADTDQSKVDPNWFEGGIEEWGKK